jgi:hypothetical protein
MAFMAMGYQAANDLLNLADAGSRPEEGRSRPSPAVQFRAIFKGPSALLNPHERRKKRGHDNPGG